MNHQDWTDSSKAAWPQEDVILRELLLMEKDAELDTRVALVREDGMPAQLVTFQEKHLRYLQEHPKVNPIPYLTNLRTMIKIRLEK